jgi:hypothetical protein
MFMYNHRTAGPDDYTQIVNKSFDNEAKIKQMEIW